MEAKEKKALMGNFKLFVMWHNKCPWLLSQLQLNCIISGQLHLDSSWKTEYLSSTKSYATPVYLWTSDVESRQKLNTVFSIKKKKRVSILIGYHLPRKRSGKILHVLRIGTSKIVLSEKHEFEHSLFCVFRFITLRFYFFFSKSNVILGRKKR